MYILDTDIVIWILRNDKNIVAAINDIVDDSLTGLSTITIGEVYQYLFPKELRICEDFLSHQEIFPVTSEIAKAGGLYWREFRPSLLKLSLADCIVVATAREQKAKLLTRNIRHFPMKDIKVLDPLKTR